MGCQHKKRYVKILTFGRESGTLQVGTDTAVPYWTLEEAKALRNAPSQNLSEFPGISKDTRPLGKSARRRGGLVPLLIGSFILLVAALLILVSVGLNSFLPNILSSNKKSSHAQAPLSNAVAGHVFFGSSGQVREDSSQGITDEVELDLSNIPLPAPGKSYYAWLLSDDSVEGKTFLLGQLQVTNGSVHFHYPGDAQHTNLLEVTNRLLVTEEDAEVTPDMPSLDKSTWRYIAEFPQKPNPADTEHHFSLLNHLRHLLAADPKLADLGIPGGLDIWLFRNSQKILEWSGGARDDWSARNTPLMHRYFIRILDYLDGLAYVQNDVPAGSPVLVNAHLAQVALLEFNVQSQDPPGFLYHIGLHLHGLVTSPGASNGQKSLAIQIGTAINKVQALLQQVRSDAKKLVMMDDTQLSQPSALSLLDDMVKHAQDAFVGQFDPTTGEIQDGVTQIHYAIQRLATLDVTIVPATTTRNTPLIVPATQRVMRQLPYVSKEV